MIRNINLLLEKSFFPLSLKIISLFVFLFLIVTGLLAWSDDASFLHQLRNTNLGNLIVWSYWWPAIIIAAILFGRVWCMVCPVEVITTFFARIGMRLKRPQWLLTGWAITIFYIIILLVGLEGLAIHRNPFYMAYYLISLAVISIIIGFLYEKNTFCRYVCPVGYLLGVYSRLSFLGWGVKDKHACQQCKEKTCIHVLNRYSLNSKSCGVDLYPAGADINTDCILCGGCLKTCSRGKAGNPNPGFQNIGFARGLFELRPLKLAEMVFVLVVSGFVISQIWSEWKTTNTWLKYFPDAISSQLGISSKFFSGIIYGIVIFLIVPSIIWLIPFLASKIAGAKLKLRDYLLHYGIAFIPIIAIAHIGKSIVKSVSRLPYFEYLFQDISGIDTARMIVEGEIKLRSTPFWSEVLVSFCLIALMIAGMVLSIVVVHRLNRKFGLQNITSSSMFLIPVLYGSIFLIMLLAWRWM
jgi:hypothetical protein